jgi:hypothetical protein
VSKCSREEFSGKFVELERCDLKERFCSCPSRLSLYLAKSVTMNIGT